MATTGNITLGAYTVIMVHRVTTTCDYIWKRPTNFEYCYGSVGLSISTVHGANTSSYNLSSNWARYAVPRTLMVSFDGTHAGHTIRINGVTQTLTTVGGADPGTATTADTLAIYSADGVTAGSSGTIAEIIVYNRALTSGEKAQVESYLRTRYAHY